MGLDTFSSFVLRMRDETFPPANSQFLGVSLSPLSYDPLTVISHKIARGALFRIPD